MAKIKVIGGKLPQTINPLLFENDFANTTNLYNVGDFYIETNLTKRVVTNFEDRASVFSQPITFETLNIDSIERAKTISEFTGKLVLNFDKKNLNNYAQYGSLKEILRVSIENIIISFPGALYIDAYNDDSFFNTVTNYSYNELRDVSLIEVPVFLVNNPFELNYVNNGRVTDPVIKDINTNYTKYVLNITGNTDYEVVGFTGSVSNIQGTIKIEVKGNPFPLGVGMYNFYIKPNNVEYKLFYNSLGNLEKYILTQDSNPIYSFTVKVPTENENGDKFFKESTYTWPLSDNYNLDISSSLFRRYLNSLLELGDIYDNFKTDVVYRMWIPSSISETDETITNKIQQLSRIYGRELDEIKLFIEGLTYVNNVSYDKVENAPDLIIKNLASTLGWETFNIIEEEDLFASIFSVGTENTTVQKTPAELDIELWRRIIMNTSYLFKSKGTRKAIEAIFAFIGAPSCLVDINEHVYLVDGKIDPQTVDLSAISPLDEQLKQLPFDDNGFPVSPSEIPTFYFQKNGNSDSGQEYIDIYRKLGFNVQKTIDNKKSWVYKEEVDERYRLLGNSETSYTINDPRLVINTKEISLYLNPIRAIECDVYDFNTKYNYPVSSSGRTFPYPNLDSNKFSANTLTFNDYINEIYSTFVNAQNRKTSGANGISYPSLYKLYYDYLNNSLSDTGVQSKKITIAKMFNYITKFQSFYNKFFNQLIPATTILTENGIVYRNSVFTPQKFDYKRGINDGSEFRIEQPKNPNTQINLISIKGNITEPYESEINIWESTGTYGYTSGGEIDTSPDSQYIVLNPLINIEEKWDSQIYSFDIPDLVMTGTTKITTGLTISSYVHLYSESNTKQLYFEFTGGSEVLSATTTTFNFKIFKYNKNTLRFDTAPVYTKNIPYTAFTSTTTSYTETIINDILLPDEEYLIKPYYTFYLPTPTAQTISFQTPYDVYSDYSVNTYPLNSDTYNYFFDYESYSAFTGTVFTTDINYNVLTKPYGIYESQNDWYFLSISNPLIPVPQLIGETPIPNEQQYINEQVTVDIFNNFTLSQVPAGDISVYVTGLGMLKDTEFVKVTSVPDLLLNRVYNIPVDEFNPALDIVTVSYLSAINTPNVLVNESEIISFIPTGTTEVPPNKILFNSSTNLYEYYLTNEVTGDTTNLHLEVNGLSLLNGTDFVLNLTNKRRIIFPTLTVTSGDVINAFYISAFTSPDTVYPIDENPFNFNWFISTPINTETGKFVLEFADETDDTFSTVFASGETVYVNGQDNYSYTVDFTQSPFNVLDSGTIYNFRIRSEKVYTGILNNTFTTFKNSDTLKIRTPYL